MAMFMQTAHSARITVGDESLYLWGFKVNRVKMVLTWLFTVFSFGIFRLLLYWYPKLRVKCTSSKCSLNIADGVLIQDEHMNLAFRPVRCMIAGAGLQPALPIPGFRMTDVSSLRYFTYKKLMHLWYPDEERFVPIDSLETDISFLRFHDMAANGLSKDEVRKRLTVYGKNLIEVKLKPIFVLLFLEFISPFYIFQLFSVSVWFTDEYEIYASVIVAMTVLSITLDVYQTRKQEKKLRSMVHSSAIVQVLREGSPPANICSEE
ncbi:unnamed protein product, partial [Gongylonema pulchrum]|uniref:Cation-transporting ATPase n=1 Tax=Gongylonema pulchrum TaxID=637853 RepID=A0A183E9F4_9BILA